MTGHRLDRAALEVWVCGPVYVFTQLLANLGPRKVQGGAYKCTQGLVLAQVLAWQGALFAATIAVSL
jgi:hypothetical protein